MTQGGPRPGTRPVGSRPGAGWEPAARVPYDGRLVLPLMAWTETPRPWTAAVERPTTSPFVLDVHDLDRRPGTQRLFQRTVPAPEDLGTVVIGVPAGSDLVLDLRLEAVMEGILVSGTVRGRAVGECVRCLEEVVEIVDADLQELYHYPERARAALEEGADEEDVQVLDGDHVDVEPAVRDAVVPTLSFRPLCSPDCLGLCPDCGVRLEDAGPDHKHETVDPRWADLGRVFDEKES